jgi:hypothetical protein
MKGTLCLSVLLLIFGCTRHPGSNEIDSQVVPADSLISRELMVRITADVHVLEAALLNRPYNRQNSKTLAGHYYKELFLKYRISEFRYHQNIVRLQRDPKDFMAFYDEVIAELDARISIAEKALKRSTPKK